MRAEVSLHSPPINFAQRSVPHRSAPKHVVSKHPDARLILACIEYAMLASGNEAGYLNDPTDSEFAPTIEAKATRLLEKITRTVPTTVDGLCSKAWLIEIITKPFIDDPDIGIDPVSLLFFRSIKSDLNNFRNSKFVENDAVFDV